MVGLLRELRGGSTCPCKCREASQPDTRFRAGGAAAACSAGDMDEDGDSQCNARDNCVAVSNADQSDLDGDGIGDA